MNKRRQPTDLSLLPKKPRTTTRLGFLYIKSLDAPFISPTTHSPFKLSCLRSGRLYTIGRSRRRRSRYCLTFDDPRISKRHCQILLDQDDKKVFLLDGFFLHRSSSSDLSDIKARFQCPSRPVRPSLNGVFVNGVRVGKGKIVELFVGDVVAFVCANGFHINIGFLVQKIVFSEEANNRREKELLLYVSLSDDLRSQALSLLGQCRNILSSADPIHYIRRCLELKGQNNGNSRGDTASRSIKLISNTVSGKIDLSLPGKSRPNSVCHRNNILQQSDHHIGNSFPCATVDGAYSGLLLNPIENFNPCNSRLCPNKDILKLSPGKRFYLNRLDLKENKENTSVNQHMVVSLPELLHPVQTLSRIFIATFTCDVLWFLSYCNIPSTLPVTIACHNTQRCWSSSPDERISTPYVDFPKLVMIYPSFPDDIAFGQDRKKQGIACHHPKLFVLQREYSIRVVVTSANLVSKQWNNVTNTVWWQDFPLRNPPDYLSLFISTDEKSYEGVKSDFAAQLAGFMASLVVDVPSEAHWIIELTKYDFGGANGHLVASVPGMHRHRTPYPLESMYFLSGNRYASRLTGMKFLGSVESSLVGLKYRFHTAADSNGAALKTLAAFIGKCREKAFGMSEVVLRRNHNIPADVNAVSVLIGDLDEFSEGDYIQLGFLPRNTAKWVASLCDAGIFSFSAYIYPKEVLDAALEGSNNKIQLILYVSQGPCFSEISGLLQPEHVASICSLIASLQRCVGLSRLQEVLGRYNWPELLETDFFYGSSSIGSINSQFLAAFASATGKRSIHFSESEESDPEWGRWNANDELKKPSMRIIFPTIERVRNSVFGIWPSRRMLCLSEGTWQRLKSADIFHDAVPHPSCRIGYPMHTKVARRRFKSKTDASSFGWVYCGSHNFSAAAWGRPISSSGLKVGVTNANYFLGSRLHICNYELGIVFIVPPVDEFSDMRENSSSIDDITLPFVVPAPKYRPNDRAATAKAMRDAIAELAEVEKEISNGQDVVEEMMDEIPEEEMVEVNEYVAEEREEEKAYAEALWSQVDSAES